MNFMLKYLHIVGTGVKSVSEFNAYNKLFVNEFVSQIERKSKVNFKERKKKEKKEPMYRDREKMFNEY